MDFRKTFVFLLCPLQEKLQLNKQKLHHCIKHVPSTNENNKDNIGNTTLRCSIIYNLVKTSKVLIGCSKERQRWSNYKCKYSSCNHFFYLHLKICKQQKKNDKVQWCINALNKKFKQQTKNIKVPWCIDALSIFATTKQKQQGSTMHQCD